MTAAEWQEGMPSLEDPVWQEGMPSLEDPTTEESELDSVVSDFIRGGDERLDNRLAKVPLNGTAGPQIPFFGCPSRRRIAEELRTDFPKVASGRSRRAARRQMPLSIG